MQKDTISMKHCQQQGSATTDIRTAPVEAVSVMWGMYEGHMYT